MNQTNASTFDADALRNAPYAWLNERACEDDIIAGATFVGDANGSRGTDWQVYDEAALRQFIEELHAMPGTLDN